MNFVYAKLDYNSRGKYAISCTNCQNERIIGYSQFYNIKIGKYDAECKKCKISTGKISINMSGLEEGRRSTVNKTKKNINNTRLSKYLELKNTLDNPAKTIEVKEKMKLAKLGLRGDRTNRWDGGFTEDRKNKRKAKRREYTKNRLKVDKVFYAIKVVRDRVSSFIRNKNLKSKCGKLGCDLATFKAHIELKFKSGMSWDNYGEWHIDHIFPLSVAAKISNEKFLEACHYTNLQPLWAIDNLKKGNRHGYI